MQSLISIANEPPV